MTKAPPMRKSRPEHGEPGQEDTMTSSKLSKNTSGGTIVGIFDKIRAWHLDQRVSDLDRTFQLGDMLLSAVIHTGLSEYQLVNRVISELGEDAYGITTYTRAIRMAVTFTANQRRVLIDVAFPIKKIDVLTTKAWDKRRVKVITEIKQGKIKSPWNQIKGLHAVDNPKTVKQLISARNEDESTGLFVSPPYDADKVLNVLKHLLSYVKMGRSITLGEFDSAVVEAKREMGMLKKRD